MEDALVLAPVRLTGAIRQESGESPIAGALWYTVEHEGAALEYDIARGALVAARYLVADMLLDGNQLAAFTLVLREGADGPAFRLTFAMLNQCSARMRAPLEAVNQNRWRYPREGAWLKPMCGGDRVDLRKVDRVRLELLRKGPAPVRFCITPIAAVSAEPAKLESLVLPAGPLLDALGQSTLHEWPGKSRDAAEVTRRLQEQLDSASTKSLPAGYSRWGGWLERSVGATGFFRTHHDGSRWWLVDPDGYLFWSSGLDCVGFNIDSAYEGLEAALTWLPSVKARYASAHHRGEGRAFDYLKANFIRAFGARAHAIWATVALAFLREAGFNTVANWSDWEIARGKVPYVRPMRGDDLHGLPLVYRDFPDVFHPDFEHIAADFAAQLSDTVDDPAFIGYFLMNEPTWGFSRESPAVGMLYTTSSCHSRDVLSRMLRERYGSDRALSDAWGMEVSFDAVAAGKFEQPLTAAARADLDAFSEQMVLRYFGTLSAACRKVDPHHLNLGIRYYTIPPSWAVAGMRSFDVFSMNCYRQRVIADDMARISAMLEMPVMVGEWHFGALDAGLPASGIGHVPDQISRGTAYRVYVEDAAARPWCVGVHYFTLYDQSALGRFDGENYQIGFLDTCNRPYEPLLKAARATHERLYQVATGQVQPFDDAPHYLPLLFV